MDIAIPASDFDPFAPEVLGNPYPHHAALRDAGPVVYLERYDVFAMARFAEVADALKNWELFRSGRGVGLSDFAKEPPWRPPSLLLETDPPEHDRARAVMNRVVTLQALKRLEQPWRAAAAELVDQALARGRCNAMTALAEAFPLRIFPDAVGLRPGGEQQLLAYATGVFNGFGPRNAILLASLEATREAAAWVAEACRRANLRPDGWGAAVFATGEEHGLGEADAERLVRSLLSAGVDTTIASIGHMLHAFARHPDQWRRLREDPALARRVFDEVLRWASPVQTFFRTTARTAAVGGAEIPAESKVLLLLASANRDPRHWDEPDRFDCARAASGHVGFGFGIHQCLGQMLARLEARLMLEELAKRVATMRLLAPPAVRINNTLHAFETLEIEFA